MNKLDLFTVSQIKRKALAQKAFEQGFFAESITLCVHQLHAILRHGLWMNAQLTMLADKSHVLNDEEIIRILGNSQDVMPDGVPSKELFFAAQRFGFLAESDGEILGSLLNGSKILLRELFDTPQKDANATYSALKPIAKALLEKTDICIHKLMQQKEELKKLLKDSL
ncbi:MAG: hypothetical protein JWM56_1037 [Candidatus Peribacteria bacterium]|nr:hypothetical protein [Candidatus Peribacteria bacterium]